MKTKVVYVLTSSVADYYLEQTYISMFSLKHHQPDAYIVLLTDRITVETFSGKRKEMVRFANEIVVVDFESSEKITAKYRAFELKTLVRNKIDGNLLYIDCDTIIVRPIKDIDQFDVPMALCRDSHCDYSQNPYRSMNVDGGKRCGWPADQYSVFHNAGVIFMKDVKETREFCCLWNEALHKCYDNKIVNDQIALAQVNYECNYYIHFLPDVWNCELKHGIRYLRDAYIVHYLCTNASQYTDKQLFLLNEKSVFLNIKETGVIGDDVLQVVDDPFKGLAELTFCFAGEDIYFFYSPVYSYLRRHFKRDKLSALFCILRLINKIERFYLHLIRVLYGKASINDRW